MEEIAKILIGIVVLVLAYPIGNFLAKKTEEELKDGREWFEAIILISIVSGVFALIYQNDILFFTFAFIAIVTSRSLRK